MASGLRGLCHRVHIYTWPRVSSRLLALIDSLVHRPRESDCPHRLLSPTSHLHNRQPKPSSRFSTFTVLLVLTISILFNIFSDPSECHRHRLLNGNPLQSLAFQGTYVQMNLRDLQFLSAAFDGKPLCIFRCRFDWRQTLIPPRFTVLAGIVSRIKHVGYYD